MTGYDDLYRPARPPIQSQPQWQPPGHRAEPAPTRPGRGMAIASMVLGIVWMWWLGSILAVIFGHISNRRAKATGWPRSGMAIAGLTLGYIGIATAAIVIIVAVASSSNSSPPAASAANNAPAATAPAATATPAQTTQAPAAPQYTASQQQAIEAAQQYLSMGTGFSKKGLIQQLSSADGNGFSVADARFAVNHVSVNWDQQAHEAAEGYMQLGGFSYSSMVQQLESSAGSDFTVAQAEYGAQSVGLSQ